MRRHSPKRPAFFAEAVLLAGLLSMAGGEALSDAPGASEGGSGPEERALATIRESERLGAGLSELWIDWEGGRPAVPVARSLSPLRFDWAFPGQADASLEAEVARQVATRFFFWAEAELPPVPEFLDAERPAPEEWAERAIRRFVREEAEALAEALEAPKAKAARALVPTFTRARFRRIAALNGGQVALIRRDEQARGLALYTAYQGLLYGRHDSYEPGEEIRRVDPAFAYQLAPGVRAALIERLRAVATGSSDDYPPELSGFAIALLLDRTRHGWRRDLQVGWKPLDALLATPLRPFGP